MRPLADYDGLARAAQGRAWIDWWLGMNASRALSLTHAGRLSAGRVQTPTLAAVVARDRAIAAHAPPLKHRVDVDFEGATSFSGSAHRPEAPLPGSLDFDPADERAGAAGIGEEVYVDAVETEDVEVPPPPFYDLDGLQQAAFRKHRFSARRTLELAQNLYERRLLTYPRTESTHIGPEEAAELPELLRAVVERRGLTLGKVPLAPESLGPRHVDAAAVGDHPALLPTLRAPPPNLAHDLAAVLDLVERRLLAAVAPAAQIRLTTVRLQGAVLPVTARGAEVLEAGGQAFEPPTDPLPVLPSLGPGEVVGVTAVRVREHRAPPPPAFDDASTLAHMRAHGLGTPATRADVLEGLLRKGYLERRGNELASTLRGRQLIDLAPAQLTAPDLTAELESSLADLRSGALALETLLDRARDLTRELVAEVAGGGRVDAEEDGALRLETAVAFPEERMERPDFEDLLLEGVDTEALAEVRRQLLDTGRAWWAASPWLATRHALLVARDFPGTCWVERSEPALVDDEVMTLRSLGVRADRLHADLDEETHAATRARYAAGALEVLFTVGDVELSPAPALHVRDLDLTPWRPPPETGPVLSLGFGADPVISDPVTSGWGEVALEVVRKPRSAWAECLRSMDRPGPTLVLGAEPAETRLAADALGGLALTAGRAASERRSLLESFLDGGSLLVADAAMVSPRQAFPGLRALVLTGLPMGIENFAERVLGPSVLDEEVRIILLADRDPSRARDRLERAFPPPAALQSVLPSTRRAEAELLEGSALEPAVGRRLLARAEAHGLVRREQDILRPGLRTLDGYAAFRRQALESLDLLAAWAAEPDCRLQLLSRAVAGREIEACGVCDVCDPDGARAQRFRPPNEAERALMTEILTVLARGGPAPRSRLRDAVGGRRVDGALDALRSARLVQVRIQVRAQREIRFFEATEEGRSRPPLDLVRVPR
ncbi:MAG: DNA topoisomerase [Myxococcota bacterium]